MSFEDVLKGRELRPYSPNNVSDAQKMVKDTIAAVFKMQTEVSRLKHDVEKLGSLRDTIELRQRISHANQHVNAIAKDVKDRLLKFSTLPIDSKQTSKIIADFEATLKDFQSTMKAARAKEAATLPRAPEVPLESRAEIPLDQVEQQTLLNQQQQERFKKLDSQMEYNEALIEERDQGIQEIQQQIAEVNEIFQDLAVLVHDQGQVIDDIEANISHTAERTKEARKEVVRAERYQRSSRNKRWFLLLVVAFVLGILVLVLFSV